MKRPSCPILLACLLALKIIYIESFFASLNSPTFIVCLYGSGGAPTKKPVASPERPPPAMTSGNESEAPAVTGSTPQNGENKPPQAIVKPQVLTHVIEGFVIQEGAEPFPVCVSGRFPCFRGRMKR